MSVNSPEWAGDKWTELLRERPRDRSRYRQKRRQRKLDRDFLMLLSVEVLVKNVHSQALKATKGRDTYINRKYTDLEITFKPTESRRHSYSELDLKCTVFKP